MNAPLEFLTMALAKYMRGDEREASARNILIYATYLCADEIGIEEASRLSMKAIDAAAKR